MVNSQTANQLNLPPDVNSCVHPVAVEAVTGDSLQDGGGQGEGEGGGASEGGETVQAGEEGGASDEMQVEESEPFVVLPNPSYSFSSAAGVEYGKMSFLHTQRKRSAVTSVPVKTTTAAEAGKSGPGPTLLTDGKVNSLH